MQERREELERVIEGHLVAQVKAGRALKCIRDRRLYRAGGKGFATFCEEHWDMTPAEAGMLIDLADIATATGLPFVSEDCGRALAVLRDRDRNVDAEAVRRIWSRAVGRSEREDVPVTARLIREEIRNDRKETRAADLAARKARRPFIQGLLFDD